MLIFGNMQDKKLNRDEQLMMFVSIVRDLEMVLMPMVIQLDWFVKTGDVAEKDMRERLTHIIVMHEALYNTKAPRYIVEYLVDLMIKAKLFEVYTEEKVKDMYASLEV
jgi:hypothetical protein